MADLYDNVTEVAAEIANSNDRLHYTKFLLAMIGHFTDQELKEILEELYHDIQKSK